MDNQIIGDNRQFQIDNCIAALREWNDVPKMDVDLERWTCGAVHCFGGWLPHMPHFRALGVRALGPVNGQPTMPRRLWPEQVAEHLFGSDTLFAQREKYEEGTDWEVVVHRLEFQLNYLLGAEA